MPGEATERKLLKEIDRSGLRVNELRFGPGELVFRPGDGADRLYLLLSGTIRLYKIYGESKEATTALLKDYGVFGELDPNESNSQEVFAEARTGVRVSVIPKSSMEWLIKRRPDVALSLLSAFSDRLRQSDELVATLLHRGVTSRLAALLINLSHRFGSEKEGEVTLQLRLTHMELSDMIASTREAVSKSMIELQRAKIIAVRDRRIVILDRRALSKLANKAA